MARLQVRVFGDPVLRQRSRTVDDFDDRLATLARDMFDTMRSLDGVGLAANQVGVLRRLFTWEFHDPDHPDEPLGGAVVNPELISTSADEQLGDEGCLSFPGLFYPLARPLEVEVRHQSLDGEPDVVKLEGHPARIWLHEMDHLDGVLFIDHLAAHDRRAAMDAMRAYRLEHGLDDPSGRTPAGVPLLGRRPS